jgi:hypothetical protein
MAKARQELELAIRVGNEPGALGKILACVNAAGVTVLAYCAYCERQAGIVLLVTDNVQQAKDALGAAGYKCRANPVVLVESTEQIGGAALVGARLGYAGIDILYSYASAGGGEEFYAVFKTNDDTRALQLLAGLAEVRV